MHVHVVPNRGSPPTVLLRESYREGAQGAQAHAGQSVELVGSANRGHSRGSARRGFAPGGAELREHRIALPWPCASRWPGHTELGLRFCARLQIVPRARAGAGDGGFAHRGAAYQAGHHALVAHHHAGRGLRCGRRERERPLCGDGLVARAPEHDPEQACRTPLERWRPGAVRPVVELLRGQLLCAGQARLQPRRQAPGWRGNARSRWHTRSAWRGR